ncbi:hypothetical protein ACG7TL_008736 [Trametes sanguinea]
MFVKLDPPPCDYSTPVFKLQMLTECIMHECIKKHLGNVENPDEEEIESLGRPRSPRRLARHLQARAPMDVYLSRMRELTKSGNVKSRMQFMLLDVLELRGRKCGGDRGDHQQPDGWAVAGGATAARQATKAGDLSQFGKISNKSTPMTFGPSSVFQKDSKSKSRESTLSRQGSSNMFSMLSANPAITAEVTSAKSSRPPSRKSSIDLGSGGAPEAPPHRRKLQLLPRSMPLENKPGSTPGTSTAASEDEGAESTNEPSMSVEEAKTRIEEDSKEFFSIRDLDEAEVYFTKLPAEHRHLLVDKLVTRAVESKEADAQLVAYLFERAHAKNLCSPATFEEGFMLTAKIIEDIAIDAPKVLNLFALMLKGAHLHEDEERRARLTSKSMDSEKLCDPDNFSTLVVGVNYHTLQWHIEAYAHAIYLLNLLLQSEFDPSVQDDILADDMEEGGEGAASPLPSQGDDEFRPFVRRRPYPRLSATRATLITTVCTFFEMFDVFVYWPILVVYWFVLLLLTMRRQIQHMIKYKYIPLDFGRKARYGLCR